MDKNDSVVQPAAVSFVCEPKETHTSTDRADRVVASNPCRLAQTWRLLLAFAASGFEISGASVAAEIGLPNMRSRPRVIEDGTKQVKVNDTFTSPSTVA
jgi:hypothetical protein